MWDRETVGTFVLSGFKAVSYHMLVLAGLRVYSVFTLEK